ncbi:MAG: hypothetical protein HY873_08850 [Chloroflexi bacterium]|nr:hypothetical protein [Chloroflexota bacterium]
MRLITIQSDDARATIAPDVGGRLLQLEIHDGMAWQPLLLAPVDPEVLVDEPLAWGCYPMTPWPGRIADAHFAWQGRDYVLPANDGPHAIHGRGVFNEWRVAAESSTSCRMELDLAGPWPFPAHAIHEIRLAPGEITLRQELRSTSDAPFPGGVGWHPWFRRDVRPGHEPRIGLDGAQVYETAPDLIPNGRLVPVSGATDLRLGPVLGERRLDSCYRDIRGPIVLRWRDLELTIASTPNMGHAVVYTPERGFCVEPQTCAPDAFNLAARGIEDTGLAVVDPGTPLIAETIWHWRRA